MFIIISKNHKFWHKYHNCSKKVGIKHGILVLMPAYGLCSGWWSAFCLGGEVLWAQGMVWLTRPCYAPIKRNSWTGGGGRQISSQHFVVKS